MGFTPPEFNYWAVFYTAVGSLVFWGRWGGRGRLRAYVISDIVDCFNLSVKKRTALDCIIFTFIGVCLSIGLVEPKTAAQAISAGLGWTGLFTHQVEE